MSKLALFIKTTCKSGKRDEVRTLWEEYLKSRAEENTSQEVYFYCYDDQNENVMYLFELYSNRNGLGQNATSDWFQEYMQKLFPLIEGQPEIGMTTPIWSKGVHI